MSAFRRLWVCAILGIAASLSGCRTPSQMAATSVHSNALAKSISVINRHDIPRDEDELAIQPVSHQASDVTISEDHPDVDELFSQSELQLDSLIAAVHARNPSVQAAQAAWCAAAERYPQVVALEDPDFANDDGACLICSGFTGPIVVFTLEERRRFRGMGNVVFADRWPSGKQTLPGGTLKKSNFD